MQRLLVIAAIALASALPASASSVSTGLKGIVTRGPVTPVCQEGVSCSAPAKHVTVVFSGRGITKSVVTGADGRYTVALAAGSYAVRIPSAKLGFTPRSVTVKADRMTTRNFSIDTGIR